MINLFKNNNKIGSKLVSTAVIFVVIFSYFAPVIEVFADEIAIQQPEQQTNNVDSSSGNDSALNANVVLNADNITTNTTADTENTITTATAIINENSTVNSTLIDETANNTNIILSSSVSNSQTVGGYIYISGYTINGKTSGTFKSDESWTLSLNANNYNYDLANKRVQVCLKNPANPFFPTISCSFADQLNPPLPGYTDANGNWEGKGKFTDAEIGNWMEYLKIGNPDVDSMVITNDIIFNVVKNSVVSNTASLNINGVVSGKFNLGTNWVLNLTTNPPMPNAPVEMCGNYNNGGFGCIPTDKLSGRSYYVNIPGTTDAQGKLTINGYFDSSSDVGNWKEYMKVGVGGNQIVSNTIEFDLVNQNSQTISGFTINNQTTGTYRSDDAWTLKLNTNNPNLAGKRVSICMKDPANSLKPTISCSYVNQLSPNPLFGYTDVNGNWEGKGVFTDAEIGNWIEYLKIGVPGVDEVISNDISFTVIPKSESGGSTGGGSTGGGSTGVSTSSPSVYITGSNPLYLPLGAKFVDPGATAFDSKGNNLTSVIVKQTNLSTTTPGVYFVSYMVTDPTNGMSKTSTRTVVVTSVNTNFFTLNDNVSGTYKVGDTWTLKIKTDNPAMAGKRVSICMKDPANSLKPTISCSYVDQLTGLNLFGYTDSNGNWTGTGSFASDTIGDWIEYIKVGTSGVDEVISNDISFTVIPNTGGGTTGGGSSSSGGGSSSSGGGGIGGRRRPVVTNVTNISDSTNTVTTGQVLGVATCSYINDYMKIGSQNDPMEVFKLQSFLNVFEKENLSLNGVFDESTYNAVLRFQNKYKEEIIAPWGQTNATGYVYILTKNKINEIYCGKDIPLTEEELNQLNLLKESINSGSVYTQIGLVQNNNMGTSTNSTLAIGSESKSGIKEENVLYKNESATSSDLNINKAPEVVLKDNTSKTKSIMNNMAASIVALPQRAFSGESFIPTVLLVILTAIIFVIVKMLFDFRKDDAIDFQKNNEDVSVDDDSPIIILPNKDKGQKDDNIPDEEIVIENNNVEMENSIDKKN